MPFTRAIVRPPAANFADGLTTVDLGVPDAALALAQHETYCRALERLGLALTRLPADPRFPDSTFVEDTAVITARGAVLTRPGAPSREGEAAAIEPELRKTYPALRRIPPPGTVDGGDVCEAGDHFFIGVSRRTNEEGAGRLARFLEADGYTASLVDIRGNDEILHLKSGIAWLGKKTLVVIDSLASDPSFRDWDPIHVPKREEYAANCVLVNDAVLVAEGFPGFENELRTRGYRLVVLPQSEFQKMDGGLSCLSLRF
ncbi:MAG TPA: arginine deiminase family protein [Thermoanaerobaculia bacterium]|jgi:dimethylargininase